MKNLIFLVSIIFVFLFLSGCQKEIEVISMTGDWPVYLTIEELYKNSDVVVIGRVDNTGPAKEIDIDVRLDAEYLMVMTPSDIKVIEPLKGNLVENDSFKLMLEGGEVKNQRFDYGIVHLEKGKKYLLFLSKNDQESPLPYTAIAPFVSILEIEGDKIIPQPKNNLVSSITDVNFLLKQLKELK